MVSPSFLPSVPLMNPRTLWGCHSVAAINSCRVAPPGRFSSSRIWAVLVPWRAAGFSATTAFADCLAFLAPLGAFLAGVAFLPDLALVGATWALCAPTRAFFLAFG